MPRKRSELEKAAGKLISAIQREWSDEAGLDCSAESEEVMHRSHDLLQAAKGGSFDSAVLGGSSIAQFLGDRWVEQHPHVISAIKELQRHIQIGRLS
ncbi:MAG: hypothetical protein LBE81_11235 [Azonexus sp.]|jgi:hypothetical protein|uniref:hypothetical protein n=1 Tax=Azonexus sp. TaxID=1872668 RepID=UPI00282A61F9|nr:hypothetical protein [Azonexus sp.]MDR0777193.1 hypothetical protein [Azonexus sp.]